MLDTQATKSTPMEAGNGYSNAGQYKLGDYARSRAWGKFQDSIGASAQVGVAAVEIGSSVNTITSRGAQLLRIARAIRKGQVDTLVQLLADPSLPRAKRDQTRKLVAQKLKHGQSKSLANQWLEWSFGISPVLQDISSATEVLSREVFTDRCTGRGSSGYVTTKSGAKPTVNGTKSFLRSTTSIVRTQYSAEVRITNPNQALASDLGLTNPFTVGLELIPFSFVLDWFGNLSQFLGGWNEFFGRELTLACTSRYAQVTDSGIWWKKDPELGVYPTDEMRVIRAASIDRSLGLQRPVLQLYPMRPISVKRAANAIALLTQFLKSS